MFWAFFFSLSFLSFAMPVTSVPSKVECDGKTVKDFSYNCAELRARDKCASQEENFDQCVGDWSGKYLRRCSKSIAKAWCKRCGNVAKPPQGCQSLGQKPLKKSQRSSTR